MPRQAGAVKPDTGEVRSRLTVPPSTYYNPNDTEPRKTMKADNGKIGVVTFTIGEETITLPYITVNALTVTLRKMAR